MRSNPEAAVIDAIDQLVNDALARPIVDDYSVNRYDICEHCSKEWHGLPKYIESRGETCPGMCATPEQVAAWREMFRNEPTEINPTPRLSDRWLWTSGRSRSVSAGLYSLFLNRMSHREIDLETDALKVMLCTNAYVPSPAHRTLEDVTNEVTGTGYTSGGVRLVSTSVTRHSDRIALNAADTIWPGSWITARNAVTYDATLDENPLISWVDFGKNIESKGGDFTIAWEHGTILTVNDWDIEWPD